LDNLVNNKEEFGVVACGSFSANMSSFGSNEEELSLDLSEFELTTTQDELQARTNRITVDIEQTENDLLYPTPVNTYVTTTAAASTNNSQALVASNTQNYSQTFFNSREYSRISLFRQDRQHSILQVYGADNNRHSYQISNYYINRFLAASDVERNRMLTRYLGSHGLARIQAASDTTGAVSTTALQLRNPRTLSWQQRQVFQTELDSLGLSGNSSYRKPLRP